MCLHVLSQIERTINWAAVCMFQPLLTELCVQEAHIVWVVEDTCALCLSLSFSLSLNTYVRPYRWDVALLLGHKSLSLSSVWLREACNKNRVHMKLVLISLLAHSHFLQFKGRLFSSVRWFIRSWTMHSELQLGTPLQSFRYKPCDQIYTPVKKSKSKFFCTWYKKNSYWIQLGVSQTLGSCSAMHVFWSWCCLQSGIMKQSSPSTLPNLKIQTLGTSRCTFVQVIPTSTIKCQHLWDHITKRTCSMHLFISRIQWSVHDLCDYDIPYAKNITTRIMLVNIGKICYRNTITKTERVSSFSR